MDNKNAPLPYSPTKNGNPIRPREELRHSPMPDATEYLIVLYVRESSVQLIIKNSYQKCMHLGT